MKKISIIVPIFNSEKYLKRCLDSLIYQTYKNLEIILIDDGSNDDSLKICKNYQEKDKRIKIYSQRNQGVSAVRNKGLTIATGDYIAFVDSDDIISKNMYEILVECLEKNNSDISCCKYIKFTNVYQFQLSTNSFNYSKNKALKLLLEEKEITNFLWDKLFKKELFTNVKFQENMIFEDLDVIYKIITKTNKITINNSILYAYYQRPNSYVHTYNENKIKNYMFIIQKRYKYLHQNYPNLKKEINNSQILSILILFQMIVLNKNKKLLEDKEILEQYKLLKELVNKTSIKTTNFKKILIKVLYYNKFCFYYITKLLYKLKF